MTKYIRLAAYLLVMMAGMAYPVSKIIRFEFPKSEGTVYLFQTGAVDPYDPFRGRYVTLSPLPDQVEVKIGTQFKHQQKVYALLKKGSDGIAEVTGLAIEPPQKQDFIAVKYQGATWVPSNAKERKANTKFVRFALPFNRFYLNEKLAPEADQLVTKLTRENRKGCLIKVRIFPNGDYVVEDLLVNGKPILEVLRNPAGKQ